MNLVAAATVFLLSFLGQTSGDNPLRSEDGLVLAAEEAYFYYPDEADCPFTLIFSELAEYSCMVATADDGSDVRLGKDCTAICPPDDDGLLRLEGTELCLQASHGGGKLKDGNKMRVYPCDKDEEMQQFEWTDLYDANFLILGLKAEKYKHFCMTNRGTNAVDGDPVIVKTCDDLLPYERRFWWTY